MKNIILRIEDVKDPWLKEYMQGKTYREIDEWKYLMEGVPPLAQNLGSFVSGECITENYYDACAIVGDRRYRFVIKYSKDFDIEAMEEEFLELKSEPKVTPDLVGPDELEFYEEHISEEMKRKVSELLEMENC